MRPRTLSAWWLVPLMLFSLGTADRETSLVQAVKKSDIPSVRALLGQHADVNIPEVDGTTALHWAVYHNDLETTDLLIGAGANVAAKNRYGVAPLSMACLNGNAVLIERLLTAGANPNTVQAGDETALMTAARTGKAGAVKALLAHGADVNARESRRQQTALMWSAAENNAAVVQVLVDAGADLNARSKAIGAQSAQEVGDRAFTALLFAVQAGAVDAVEVLLAAGASVNETLPDGMSALVLAIANAQYDMAAFLLDKGADPNAAGQGWAALHQLIWIRKPNTGLNTVSPRPRGQVDSMKLVKMLLAHGANVNARATREPSSVWIGRTANSKIGATPFFLAAHKLDLDLMRVLLAQGADPLIPNEEESTPLMAAAGLGLNFDGAWGTVDEVTEAVRLCLEVGGDATAVNRNGDTALHGVAFTGSTGAAELLVAKGAKLDVVDSRGWTPLRIATGVLFNSFLRTQPAVEALLRQWMQERGLSTELDEATSPVSLRNQSNATSVK